MNFGSELGEEYVLGWKEAPEKFSSTSNKNCIRNMYWGGRKLQRIVSSILNKE